MGQWLQIESAAAALGVSTRTLQRRVKLGEMSSRIEHGRREVFIDQPERAGGDTVTQADTLTVAVAERAQAHAEALSVMSDRVATLAEQRVEEMRADLGRARRWAIGGWTVAGVVLTGAALGGLWVARMSGESDAHAKATDARAASLEALAARERERADALLRAMSTPKPEQPAEQRPEDWPPVPYPLPESLSQSLDDR